MPDPDKALSTDQVAKRLGLEGRAGQRQVVRLIEAGMIRATNVSSGNQRPRWKVRESALAEWIKLNEPAESQTLVEWQENRAKGNFLRQERRERLRGG